MLRPSVRLCVTVCTVALAAACSEPPHKEMNRAQGAIDAARAAGAEQYAPEPFAQATAALRESHEAVAQRDYRLALSRAVDAIERAQEAAKQASDGTAKARSEAELAINAANVALMQLDARLKTAESARVQPRALATARKAAQDAAGALQKARTSLSTGRYMEATAAVAGLQERIRSHISAVDEATAVRTGRRVLRRG